MRKIITVGVVAMALASNIVAMESKASFIEAMQTIKEIQANEDGKKKTAIGAAGGSVLPPPPPPGIGGMQMGGLLESEISNDVKNSKLYDEDVIANTKTGIDREKALPRAIGFTCLQNKKAAYIAFDGKVFKLKEGSRFGNFKIEEIKQDHLVISMLVGNKKAKTYTSYVDISAPKIEQNQQAQPILPPSR